MSLLTTRALMLCGGLLAAASSAGSAQAAPFQVFAQSSCEGASSSCQFPAHTVPANRRVRVTSVSCLIRVESAVQIEQAYLRKNSFVFDFFTPTLTSSNPNRYFAFNAETLFIANGGEQLLVGLVATGDIISMHCKLSGEIVAAS